MDQPQAPAPTPQPTSKPNPEPTPVSAPDPATPPSPAPAPTVNNVSTASAAYISNPLEMIKPSLQALKLNLGALVKLVLVQFVPVLAIIAVMAFALSGLGSLALLLGAVTAIGMIILVAALAPAYTVVLLQSVKGQKIGAKAAFEQGKPYIFKLIGVVILYGLAVLGGLILFIIPGLILSIWFSLSFYALIAENLGVVASMKRSRELIRGRFWDMVGLSLLPQALTGIPVVGQLVSFVLGIVLIPAAALRYTQLAGTKPESRPAVHWVNYAVIVVAILSSVVAFAISGNSKAPASTPSYNTPTNYDY